MSSVPSISAVCTLAFRAARPRTTRAVIVHSRRAALIRSYADATNDADKLPTAPANDNVGPNMQQAEHVSEEAAKMAKITGGEGPDIEGQGTPVQEILKNEPETRANAPQVLKSESSSPSSKRSFSTFARSMQASIDSGESSPAGLDPSMIPTSEQRTEFASSKSPLLDIAAMIPASASPAAKQLAEEQALFRYPPPRTNFPKRDRKNHREEPLITQLTKLMMKDGKLARAQRWMAYIENALRSSPAPTYSSTRSLMPNAPPAHELPLDPVTYITLAIDSLAPLLKITRIRGAAGGGRALELPTSLTLRQRRRQAFIWILDSATKKPSRASGRYLFAQKVADEIIAIIEGRSALWAKRDALHKAATVTRANLSTRSRGKKRM